MYMAQTQTSDTFANHFPSLFSVIANFTSSLTSRALPCPLINDIPAILDFRVTVLHGLDIFGSRSGARVGHRKRERFTFVESSLIVSGPFAIGEGAPKSHCWRRYRARIRVRVLL